MFWGAMISIAVFGLGWHVFLLVRLALKAKAVAQSAKPLTLQIQTILRQLEQKASVNRPALAIEIPMDEVLVERLKRIRHRRNRKIERQRRLVANLKKIDPTERRFTRVRKRS